MDELISKRAVIEAIEKARANVGHNLERSIGKSIIEILDDVGRDVDRLPPAEPQIVRCKDCNFWTKQKDSLQGRCALMRTYPTGNWFCGNAERGEDE